VVDADESGFKVTDRRRRESEQPKSRADAEEAAASPDDAGDLRGLFVMLATQALYFLGEVPDPDTKQRSRDLPRCSEMIDVLMLLRSKTEGHLTTAESQTLEQLLYDLQMRYVGATRPAG
jgi:hypothetical protein